MATDPFFRMPIEDKFSIAGRGTVVTGRIENGTLNVGDEVYINHMTGGMCVGSTKTHVTGIEALKKILKQARQGDTVGVLLRGIKADAIGVGDVLSASAPVQ